MELTLKNKRIIYVLLVFVGLPIAVTCAASNSLIPGTLFGFAACLRIDGLLRK